VAEGSDDTFGRIRGQVGIGGVGMGEDRCDSVIATEAASNEKNLVGFEPHRSLRDREGKQDEYVWWHR